MNEELQQALAELITKSTEGLVAGAEFAKDQLPDVLAQLLQYNFAKSLLVTVIATVVMAYYVIKVLPGFWKSAVNYNCAELVVFGTTMLLGVCAAVLATSSWLQIWLAPKVYLIEYAAKLAQGV